MASITTYRPRVGPATYYVRWREGGTRDGAGQRRSFADRMDARDFAALVTFLGNTTPSDAQLAAHGLSALCGPSAPAPVVPSTTELATAYVDHLAGLPRANARTIATYRHHIARRVDTTVLGATPADVVGVRDVLLWQHELLGGTRRYAPDTVRATRSTVLAPAFRWAAGPLGGEILPPSDFWRTVAMPARVPFRREILTDPGHYRVMLLEAYAIRPAFGDLLLAEATTAIRWSEAAALRAEDYDPARQVITIRRHVSGADVLPGRKGHPEAHDLVPVTPALAARLAGRTHGPLLPAPSGRAWVDGADDHLWLLLRKALAGHGVTAHLTHHSLRHGLAAYCSAEGVPDARIKLLLGHRPRTVTDAYTMHLSDKDLSMFRAHAHTLTT
jgi:integrase